MEETDWARIYAAMDRRVDLKYQQLPIGEQVGKIFRRDELGNEEELIYRAGLCSLPLFKA